MPVVDASGVELPRDTVLQGAQRLGGDAVLIARGDSAALNGVYQWTLQTQYATENWNGALDAGVNGAVDALARVQDSAAPLAELEALVQIGGVSTLNDYAAVSRLLEGIPGTRRVTLAEVNGGAATFSVLVRGGAEAVDRALSSSARLSRAGICGQRAARLRVPAVIQSGRARSLSNPYAPAAAAAHRHLSPIVSLT